jgi:hypothetical protein
MCCLANVHLLTWQEYEGGSRSVVFGTDVLWDSRMTRSVEGMAEKGEHQLSAAAQRRNELVGALLARLALDK